MGARRCFAALILAACCVTTVHGYIVSEEEAKRMVISTPRPEYPFKARRHWVEGSGSYILRVQIRTGFVKTVVIERSTASQLLDSSAVTALKRWRFKPGVLRPISVELPKRKDPLAKEDSFVRVPVNFVMQRGT
jgi:TonB family protein